MSDEIRNPVKAIRAFCLECAGSTANVEECNPTFGCALHEFRFGKNPYRKPKILTEEQKQALMRGRQEKQKLEGKSSHSELN